MMLTITTLDGNVYHVYHFLQILMRMLDSTIVLNKMRICPDTSSSYSDIAQTNFRDPTLLVATEE